MVLYFDIESLPIPIDSAQSDPDKSNLNKIEKHEPSDYGLVAMEQHAEKLLVMRLDRFPDCVSDFV